MSRYSIYRYGYRPVNGGSYNYKSTDNKIIGFKFTDDGSYDFEDKRITNMGYPRDEKDAAINSDVIDLKNVQEKVNQEIVRIKNNMDDIKLEKDNEYNELSEDIKQKNDVIESRFVNITSLMTPISIPITIAQGLSHSLTTLSLWNIPSFNLYYLTGTIYFDNNLTAESVLLGEVPDLNLKYPLSRWVRLTINSDINNSAITSLIVYYLGTDNKLIVRKQKVNNFTFRKGYILIFNDIFTSL